MISANRWALVLEASQLGEGCQAVVARNGEVAAAHNTRETENALHQAQSCWLLMPARKKLAAGGRGVAILLAESWNHVRRK